MSQPPVAGSAMGGLDDFTQKMVVRAQSSPPYTTCVTPPSPHSPLVLDLSNSVKKHSDYTNGSESSRTFSEKSLITVTPGLFSIAQHNDAKNRSCYTPSKSNYNNKNMKTENSANFNIGSGLSTIDSSSLSAIDSFCMGSIPNTNSQSYSKTNRVVTAQATIIPPLASAIIDHNNSPKVNGEQHSPPLSPSQKASKSKLKSPKRVVDSTLSPPSKDTSPVTNGSFKSPTSPARSLSSSPQVSSAGSEVKAMPANPLPSNQSPLFASSSPSLEEANDGGRLTIFKGGKLLLELSSRATNPCASSDFCWVQVKSSKTYWPPSSPCSSSPQHSLQGFVKREIPLTIKTAEHRKSRPSHINNLLRPNQSYFFKIDANSRQIFKKSRSRKLRNPFYRHNPHSSIPSFALNWTISSTKRKYMKDVRLKRDNLEREVNLLQSRASASDSKQQERSFVSPKKRFLSQTDTEDIPQRKKAPLLPTVLPNSQPSKGFIHVSKNLCNNNNPNSSFCIDYLLNKEKRNDIPPLRSIQNSDLIKSGCSPIKLRPECDIIKLESDHFDNGEQHHKSRFTDGARRGYEERFRSTPTRQPPSPSPQPQSKEQPPPHYPPMYPFYDPHYLRFLANNSLAPQMAVAAAAAAAAAASISSMSSYGLPGLQLSALASQYSSIFNQAALMPALAAAAANPSLAAGLPASLTPALTPGSTPQPSGSTVSMNPPPTLTPGMSPQPPPVSMHSSYPGSSSHKHPYSRDYGYQKDYTHEYGNVVTKERNDSRDYSYARHQPKEPSYINGSTPDYYHREPINRASLGHRGSPMGPPLGRSQSPIPSSPWRNHRHPHSTEEERQPVGMQSGVQDMPLNLSKPRQRN